MPVAPTLHTKCERNPKIENTATDPKPPVREPIVLSASCNTKTTTPSFVKHTRTVVVETLLPPQPTPHVTVSVNFCNHNHGVPPLHSRTNLYTTAPYYPLIARNPKITCNPKAAQCFSRRTLYRKRKWTVMPTQEANAAQ